VGPFLFFYNIIVLSKKESENEKKLAYLYQFFIPWSIPEKEYYSFSEIKIVKLTVFAPTKDRYFFRQFINYLLFNDWELKSYDDFFDYQEKIEIIKEDRMNFKGKSKNVIRIKISSCPFPAGIKWRRGSKKEYFDYVYEKLINSLEKKYSLRP